MRRISVLALPFLVACTPAGEGNAPPLDAIYFPTGLALSKDSRHLYVVNSDFDLQYNAGTLQSLDMEHIRALVPRGCTDDSDCPVEQYCDVPVSPTDPVERSFWCVDRSGDVAGLPCGNLQKKSSSERVTVPGRCEAVKLTQPPDSGSSLLIDAVEIGAFATDALARSAPDGMAFTERVFAPVRGEASVNWMDVAADGTFQCGQGSSHVCDESHRIGRDPSSNARGIVLPPEPFAIDATPDADAIVITHQTQGAVSLLRNDWQIGPHLEFVYRGLPPMPIGVKAVPQPAAVTEDLYAVAPGFLVAYETTARVDLFRFASDEQSAPARPYLELSRSTGVLINSGGYDVRSIAIDDTDRRRCERDIETSAEACRSGCGASPDSTDACSADCNRTRDDGLLNCANVPLTVYAASRSPASLLIGHTRPSAARAPNDDIPYFEDAIALATGPSRIQIAHIINTSGQPETRVLIACFDSRRIALFDPVLKRVEAWITTGRGPQSIVEDFAAPTDADEGHALAVVGHFTDSYLGVIQLDRRRGRSYATIVLSLGTATAPRTSK